MSSLSTPKSEAEVRPAASAFLALAVFLAHVGIGVILYRGRVISKWAISDADLVIFAIPFILAAAGYFYAFRWMPWLHGRRSARIVASLCASFLSWWAYMLIALNTYGS